MNAADIRNVFGDLEDKFMAQLKSNSHDVLNDIHEFIDDSLNGVYYAPFDINSKNCSHIPEETDLWFEKLAEYLTECSHLSKQGQHQYAVQCFGLLFELIEQLGSDDIVFADEYGMWMLPIREEPCIEVYIVSAAAALSRDKYVQVILQLLDYDKPSFMNKVYEKAARISSKEQMSLLTEKVIELNIRTS